VVSVVNNKWVYWDLVVGQPHPVESPSGGAKWSGDNLSRTKKVALSRRSVEEKGHFLVSWGWGISKKKKKGILDWPAPRRQPRGIKKAYEKSEGDNKDYKKCLEKKKGIRGGVF